MIGLLALGQGAAAGGGEAHLADGPYVAATSPSVVAEALIPAPVAEVFAYLSDRRNHWELADRFIEVVSLERSAQGAEPHPATGGRVRILGPLGVRRMAATRVRALEPPHRMTGSAHVGRSTRAEVEWTLTASRGQTAVRLEARVLRAGMLDRILLSLGGRAWLRRRFAGVLAHLGQRFSADPGTRHAPDFSLAATAAWLAGRVVRIWLEDARRRLRRRAGRRRADRESRPTSLSGRGMAANRDLHSSVRVRRLAGGPVPLLAPPPAGAEGHAPAAL